MMVPDYAMIAEIKLYSYGYEADGSWVWDLWWIRFISGKLNETGFGLKLKISNEIQSQKINMRLPPAFWNFVFQDSRSLAQKIVVHLAMTFWHFRFLQPSMAWWRSPRTNSAPNSFRHRSVCLRNPLLQSYPDWHYLQIRDTDPTWKTRIALSCIDFGLPVVLSKPHRLRHYDYGMRAVFAVLVQAGRPEAWFHQLGAFSSCQTVHRLFPKILSRLKRNNPSQKELGA